MYVLSHFTCAPYGFFIAIHVHSLRPSDDIEAMVDADLLASWYILKFGLLEAHGFLPTNQRWFLKGDGLDTDLATTILFLVGKRRWGGAFAT